MAPIGKQRVDVGVIAVSWRAPGHHMRQYTQLAGWEITGDKLSLAGVDQVFLKLWQYVNVKLGAMAAGQ